MCASVLAIVALSGAYASTSGAEVIYNNIPAQPKPANLPSLGYEATSTSEFGGQVEFAGSARKATRVTVGMSSWACESGTWTGNSECVTASGAKFSWPLTLKLYQVGAGGAVGAPIPGATVTQTFQMPYRPSQNNAKCKGESYGAWYDAGTKECFHGKFFKVTFKLPKVELPSKAIVVVAYNTSDHGAEPQRPQPCDSTSAGCPYDSLNVAVETGEAVAPKLGAQPLPEDAYLSSTWGGAYCDGGASGTGSLRLDTGCWAGYQPVFTVKAAG